MSDLLREAMRAAGFDWEHDPRVVPALLAMLHDRAGTLPVQFDASWTVGDGDALPDHFVGCPDVGVSGIKSWPDGDGDGCRVTRLRAMLTCPHTRGCADYGEYGDLVKLLRFVESKGWPVGAWLTAADPEPAPDSTVVSESGSTWIRFGDRRDDGAANWERWDDESDTPEPESWPTVAGSYGPVRLVAGG